LRPSEIFMVAASEDCEHTVVSVQFQIFEKADKKKTTHELKRTKRYPRDRHATSDLEVFARAQ
jgi:hypothetical protein